jgi:hypothetical protein
MNLGQQILSIIRVNAKYIDEMSSDMERFIRRGIFGVSYEVPVIKVLVSKPGRGVQLVDKPLLINYGFLRIPRYIARDHNKLSVIVSCSQFIQGFFYRDKEDLMGCRVAGEFPPHIPTLVKSIAEDELQLLFRVAEDFETYNSSEGVSSGDTILLRGYPFEGLSAKVLRKKANGKVQVQLLSTDMTLWVDSHNLYYNYSGLEDLS